MNADLVEAIKSSAAVPSMPQVVVRFLEVIQDPDFEYDELVKGLSADPGTVSEVLRLSNSALFGVRRKITSLRQGLTLLGPKRVRSLVLGRYLVGTMSSKKIADFDMSYFWRRSLASAVVAARFSDRLAPRMRDDAFISALLADVGVPILAEAMPDKYGDLAARYCPHGTAVSEDEERAAVGATHAELAAAVLGFWSLPDLITRAVGLHSRDDTEMDGGAGTLAMILNAADRVSRALCEVPDKNTVLTCAEAISLVGIEVDVLLELLTQVEKDVEELASILRIDVIPSRVYSLIADGIRQQLASGHA